MAFLKALMDHEKLDRILWFLLAYFFVADFAVNLDAIKMLCE